MKILPLLGCLLAASSIGYVAQRAEAQVESRSVILPDESLSNKSIFNGNSIDGGVSQGGNLFHSFERFSIGKDQPVSFLNPVDVKNIIARVTGTEASKIDGILGVKGAANLFFLNPNGISFGSEARLDMQGTFVASTASELKFKEGGVYSATSPQLPLLTMTTPMGLQFGGNTGNIDLSDSKRLLDNYTGSSIVLSGGNITLNQSKITLPGGKIELVSIGNNGTADIDYSKLTDRQELSATVPDKQVMADIFLKNGSSLSTTSSASGGIGLSGGNIKICGISCDVNEAKEDTDTTISRIEAKSTEGNAVKLKGGDIRLDATDKVLIDGKSSDGKKISSGISTSLEDGSKINGGDIIINAKNLSVLNGGSLNNISSKDSLGNGGDIKLNIADTLELSAARNGQESEIGSNAGGTGKSGNNIIIHTDKLIHKDGAQIFTDNSDGFNDKGTGENGDIKIVATESVEVSGVSRAVKLFGFAKATGITSFTISPKNSGNIEIQTPRFFLKNGASISAGTDGFGNGGLVSIIGLNSKNAELVELVGNSGISESLKIDQIKNLDGIGNGSRIRSITNSNGNAGMVTIKADLITLKRGARIDVSTSGKGNEGSINIQSKKLELLDGAQLISTSDGASTNSEKNQFRGITIVTDMSIVEGKDSRFEATKAFIGFINAANSNAIVKTALDNFLNKPNAETKQNLITLLNSRDPSIISLYLTVLETNNDAKQALRNFLQPRQILTIPDAFFLNRSENSAVLGIVLTTKTRVESLTEPGAPNITQDCRAINNTQISKLASSGKGGIAPNPNELIPTNNIWTDKAGIANTDKPTPTITAAKGWIAGQGRTVILTSQPNSYQSISSNSTDRNCYAK